MLHTDPTEELICLAATLDRPAVLRQIRNFRAGFPIDFTAEYLEFLDRAIRAIPSQGASHYACWDHELGQALCGFTFTRQDGVTPVDGELSCPECVREKRLAAEQWPG